MLLVREVASLTVCFSYFHNLFILLELKFAYQEHNTDKLWLDVRFDWKLSHDGKKEEGIFDFDVALSKLVCELLNFGKRS